MTDIVADIINGFVAAGTLTMAGMAYRQIRQTKESILASVQTAEATLRAAVAAENEAEATVAAFKSGLRPTLDLSIVAHNDDSFRFSVVNKGVGPGIVRVLTGRHDMAPSDLLVHALRNAVVAAGETRPFQIRKRPDRHYDGDSIRRRVTSLSVWYEDMFGDVFRSRLVFSYGNESVGVWESVPMALDITSEEGLPVLDLNKPDNAFSFEGGCPILDRAGLRDLYKLTATRRIREHGKKFAGNAATADRPLQIRNISFYLNDYPSLELVVDGFEPFVLTYYNRKGENAPGVQIDEPEEIGFGDVVPSLSNKSIEKIGDLPRFGLIDKVDLYKELASLYVSIVNELSTEGYLWSAAKSER